MHPVDEMRGEEMRGEERRGDEYEEMPWFVGGRGVGGARGFIPNGFLWRKKMPALSGHFVLFGLLACLRLHH